MDPFRTQVERYERWFEDHRALYWSELRLVRALFPAAGRGLEVGVGTGRFAAPLGIGVGVEPSPAMAARAQARGVLAVLGRGEALPFLDGTFARVLIVVALCFAEDPTRMLAEAWRVLAPGGALGVGIVDRDSAWGRHYRARATDPFYRRARFYAAGEVEAWLRGLGPAGLEAGQTLCTPPPGPDAPEWPRAGYGQGGFVFFVAYRA